MRKAIFLSMVTIIAQTFLCNAQQGINTFNTLTFFYVDNSEGYNSDPLNSSMNSEVGEEMIKKINGVADKPDNYFYLMGCNGDNPKQSNNAKSLLGSDWVKKYIGNTSRESDYATERMLLRESFTMNKIKIKKQVDVYLFLSGFAVGQLTKKMEELPTPVFFPKEMGIYLNNKDIVFNIYLYTNKEAVDQLTLAKINNYILFCNSTLNQNNYSLEVFQF